ncbi:hypothetical protein [Paraburkholderia sp. SIMBA_054]|uniref:hypothetical protein n=1 Tax=Paraburkholderia sp. SIMBA_054 TaxID=3085795 RepID=UPI00397BA9B9
MRIIVHSQSRGTLLGFSGLAGWVFFSKDPGDATARERAKQTALTFRDEADARTFIDRRHGYTDIDAAERFPADLTFVPVETDLEYAPVDVCVAAGVPRWNAPEVAQARMANVELTESRVGHSILFGTTMSSKSAFLAGLIAMGHIKEK